MLSNGVAWVTVLIKDLDRKSRDEQRSAVIVVSLRAVFYSASFGIQIAIEGEIIMARLWLVLTGGNAQEVM